VGPRSLARRSTAQDVAKLVGCSVSAVSLVVNGKSSGRVSNDTVGRIWKAVAELEYRLNTSARSLATGQSGSLAFVCPDPTNPFFSLVMEGITSALTDRYELTLLVPSFASDYGRATVHRALAGDFAGLLLASPGRWILDGFVPTCPTIVLDSGGEASGLACIDLDVHSAGREVAEHLTSLGHRTVAYVGISRDKASLQHRRTALATALAEHNAELVAYDLVLEELSIAIAEKALPGAWDRWSRQGVTAIVCGDELYAYGIMQAARALGLDVPRDVSIVGFNNLVYSTFVQPSLTSVDMSARVLGIEAGRALQHYIDSGHPPASRLLKTLLVVRQSTGQAPTARSSSGPEIATPR